MEKTGNNTNSHGLEEEAAVKSSYSSSPETSSSGDESDGCDSEPDTINPAVELNTSKAGKKTLNGKSEVPNCINVSGTMADEELIRQLKLHKISIPAVTDSTRPILIKQLNYAAAKRKRKPKSFAEPIKSFQDDEEEQEVYSMVGMMIDLLARHQASMHVAYLAVTQVRDFLIPLKEQKSNAKLRDKAVQSPVRPEIQPIEGEDLHVGHRWAFSPDKSTAHEDQSDEASSSNNSSVTPRPKLWQGQAFNTDGSGVSSPHLYPLTQCLKVRNMFDAKVEEGDSWPVRIQNVILDKADNKGDILHMAVDRGSREGCVYIKCASADDAGKVYHSLHGWWFDGNLVTVKYLSPERYQYRFPESVKTTFQLMQPSNVE